MPPPAQVQQFSLHTSDGARKYLNPSERQRVLAAMETLAASQALFCLTLAWSGGRVSEILALTPSSFDIDRGVVAIRTLKRRMHHVREVPIPPELMRDLDRHFRLSAKQRVANPRLWPWHRVTAWRIVKRVMARAGISGCRAAPKGLRHGFGVAALRFVPVTLLKKWLGHARLETTAIYLDVTGDEERALAAPFWKAGQTR